MSIYNNRTIWYLWTAPSNTNITVTVNTSYNNNPVLTAYRRRARAARHRMAN